jgi:hypothetical protein
MPRVLRIFNRLILGGPAFNVTFLTKFLEPDFETKLIIGAKDAHEQEAIFLKEDYGLNPIEIQSMKRAIHFQEDRKAYLEIKKIIQSNDSYFNNIILQYIIKSTKYQLPSTNYKTY